LVLGGTPQFLEDTRRGLFGYEALRSRLCDSRFADAEFQNLIGPVIRLRRLSDDELYALMQRMTALYAEYYGTTPRISDAEKLQFLQLSLDRAGAGELMTPREMLRDYMTVLNILMQNPNVDFARIAGKVMGESKPAATSEETATASTNPANRAQFDPADIDF